MRQRDPLGAYKVSAVDGRLMTGRKPQDGEEDADQYYTLLPEGVYDGFDGFTKKAAPRFGLDINRTYPAGYVPITGTGSVPGHLPESAAMIEAIVGRPNICSALTYHTTGNQVRPPDAYLTNAEDKAMLAPGARDSPTLWG